jgi:hypothetical protein
MDRFFVPDSTKYGTDGRPAPWLVSLSNHDGARKPKPKVKSKPLVKASKPTNKDQNSLAGGQKQEVDYHSVNAAGETLGRHALGLSETFIGPAPKGTKICTPPCIQKDPAFVNAGEFEDTWGVNPNSPFTVERRWTVDGQSAQVLDESNKPFDFEILRLSNENNPVFQLEYKNDPPQ